jgi:FKBP-type peptidyl-prolyl cis-trans isomerase
MIRFVIIIASSFLLVAACKNNRQKQPELTEKTLSNEQWIALNKAYVAEENDQIESLLLRYQWPVVTTATGVRYWINEKGSGKKINNGDEITYSYSIRLINGNEVYNSNVDGLRVSKLGASEVPAGLEEIILTMHQGDAAKIIIPSYLAYGVAGDGDRIPSKSTLIYEIKILEVKQKN